jgi:hypothetical protein
MAIKQFSLLGDPTSHREIDIGVPGDIEELRAGLAEEYSIVVPDGMFCLGQSSASMKLIFPRHRVSG